MMYAKCVNCATSFFQENLCVSFVSFVSLKKQSAITQPIKQADTNRLPHQTDNTDKTDMDFLYFLSWRKWRDWRYRHFRQYRHANNSVTYHFY